MENQHQCLIAKIIAELAREKELLEPKIEKQQELAIDSEFEIFAPPISTEIVNR